MDSRSLTLAGETELETGVTSSPQGSLHEEKELGDRPPTDKEDEAVENETNREAEREQKREHPSGVRMAFIVVALVLSVFLVRSLPSVQR